MACIIATKNEAGPGNRILCRINLLAYARRHGHRLRCCGVPEIVDDLDVDFSEGTAKEPRKMHGLYLGSRELEGLRLSHLEQRAIAREYLSPRLLIEPTPFPPDAVLIVLRGSECLSNPRYFRPPVPFYRAVIRDNGFAKVFYCQVGGGGNQCGKALEKEFSAKRFCASVQRTAPSPYLEFGSYAAEFRACLGARHLCFGTSTFPWAAALLAVDEKTLYLPADRQSVLSGNMPGFGEVVYYGLRKDGYNKRFSWRRI